MSSFGCVGTWQPYCLGHFRNACDDDDDDDDLRFSIKICFSFTSLGLVFPVSFLVSAELGAFLYSTWLSPPTLYHGRYFFQNAASNNSWHTAGQILDDIFFVFHHLHISFKLFIFRVVKNLALNKRTRCPDVPQCCLNCTRFDKLILRKIIKIVATRCHILKPKCTKFDFRPRGGAYSAPQTT